MILNNAENILIGNQQAEKVYLGTIPIWENLPAEYRKVSYIQSTGTQFLRTPWEYSIGNPNPPNVKIEITACNDDNFSIFGARGTFNLLATNGEYVLRCYNSSTSAAINTNIAPSSNMIKWTFDTNTLYANGSLIGTTTKTSGTGGRLPILLFARYDDRIGHPDNDNGGGNCKIAFFKVQQDSTLVCEMVSCIRKADNIPGMYDKVTGTFYSNAGTGDFIVPV